MTVQDEVHRLLAPIVATVDIELCDVEFSGSTLRVLIDEAHPTVGDDGRMLGITTDRLAEVNRLISPILDQHDPIPGRYTLEVSSPGLERPLRRVTHFQRAVGEEIVVKAVPSVVPRRYRGRLVAVQPPPGPADPGPAAEDTAGSAAEDTAGSAAEDTAGSAAEGTAGSAAEGTAGSAAEGTAGSAAEATVTAPADVASGPPAEAATVITLVAAEIDGVELAEPEERELALAQIASARTVFAWGPGPKPGQPKARAGAQPASKAGATAKARSGPRGKTGPKDRTGSKRQAVSETDHDPTPSPEVCDEQ